VEQGRGDAIDLPGILSMASVGLPVVGGDGMNAHRYLAMRSQMEEARLLGNGVRVRSLTSQMGNVWLLMTADERRLCGSERRQCGRA
jgi:hypothetical protein